MCQSKEIDESEVIENLLRSSDEFREFYNMERPRAGQIKWCYAPNLQERLAANAAHVADINGKHKKICLTRFPVHIDDAHIVAHEIVHAIFSEEKNTLIVYERKNPILPLSPYLNSMLEDPIVESLLHGKYNFSLSKDYLHVISIIKGHHENIGQPLDRFSLVAYAFNLGNQIMCWKLIEDQEMLKTWNDFLIWYGHPRRCPDVVLIGKDLAAIMENVGLTTIDKRRTVLLEVIKKYKLENYLSLENKFHPTR
jgi:hypothetical protein